MIRRPPRSTRTEHTLSLHDALPISDLLLLAAMQLDRAAQLVDVVRHGDVGDVGAEQPEDAAPHRPSWSNSTACSSAWRSEEHTSELQSLMRISYAVFCLKKKNTKTIRNHNPNT